MFFNHILSPLVGNLIMLIKEDDDKENRKV